MNKRYDVFGDSECLTIIGTSVPTLAHALTVQMKCLTLTSPVPEPFNLNAKRIWLVEHITMSRDLPAELVRPLLLAFLSLNGSNNYYIGVTAEARALWDLEDYRDTYKSLLELEYEEVGGYSMLKFDPAEWKQWLVDNDIEFVQPGDPKEG